VQSLAHDLYYGDLYAGSGLHQERNDDHHEDGGRVSRRQEEVKKDECTMYEGRKIAQFGRFFSFFLHICKKSSTFAPAKV
jgi:hypothetical protein